MKKSAIVCICLIWLFHLSYAQQHSIGVFAGPSYMRSAHVGYHKDEHMIMDNKNHVPGFSTGINYNLQLFTRLNIGVDFMYMHRRFHNSIDPLTYYYGYEDRGVINSYRFNYLSLPIKLGVALGEKRQLYMNFGIAPGILLNTRHKVTVIDDHYTYYEVTGLRDYDLSGIAEFRYIYPLQQFDFFASASWWHNILSPHQDAGEHLYMYIHNNKKYRQYGLNFSLGVRYSFTSPQKE